jgi:hypothetical protein
MDETLIISGAHSSDTEPAASQILRQDTYLVWNPLTPSELEWLLQQRLRVAAAYGRLDPADCGGGSTEANG